MKVKVQALKKFENLRDKERNVIPKEGEIWETSKERAEFLESKNVVRILEEIKEKPKTRKKTTLNKRKSLDK